METVWDLDDDFAQRVASVGAACSPRLGLNRAKDGAPTGADGLRRLSETFVPDDAESTVAFKEGRRVRSRLSARRSDTEHRRQDK